MKRFRKFGVILIIIEMLIIGISNAIYFYNTKNNTPEILREEEDGQSVYRVTYHEGDSNIDLILMNSSLATISLMSIITFIYIDRKIIKPFSDIKEIPYELAKGNLSIPLKEQKNKYFGKFTWGMDMLRENLEDNKKES